MSTKANKPKQPKPVLRKFFAAPGIFWEKGEIEWCEAEVSKHGEHNFKIEKILSENGKPSGGRQCAGRALGFRSIVLCVHAHDTLSNALGYVLLGALETIVTLQNNLKDAETRHERLTKTVERIRAENGACTGSVTTCKCASCAEKRLARPVVDRIPS